ncbi:hypothetical protein BAUCODRAFT_123238 [Baudoinia panamericana UAMH 10762]|uniref:Uncharacterized protein n=1 Tax=Baudoinia panamericana (strain UAMH 10762) TaxID=717646 RepID=M2LNM8_BAUPA|nr:uncharacterized protein BAUCODRAFT_123238 [Baudoinia panamericana UAMH 10762]EMC95957.1 hypothetical protein BAUCODRAFT_123238 [Baudoinia panamericana UAMH 10762]
MPFADPTLATLPVRSGRCCFADGMADTVPAVITLTAVSAALCVAGTLVRVRVLIRLYGSDTGVDSLNEIGILLAEKSSVPGAVTLPPAIPPPLPIVNGPRKAQHLLKTAALKRQTVLKSIACYTRLSTQHASLELV